MDFCQGCGSRWSQKWGGSEAFTNQHRLRSQVKRGLRPDRPTQALLLALGEHNEVLPLTPEWALQPHPPGVLSSLLATNQAGMNLFHLQDTLRRKPKSWGFLQIKLGPNTDRWHPLFSSCPLLSFEAIYSPRSPHQIHFPSFAGIITLPNSTSNCSQLQEDQQQGIFPIPSLAHTGKVKNLVLQKRGCWWWGCCSVKGKKWRHPSSQDLRAHSGSLPNASKCNRLFWFWRQLYV